MALKAVAAPLGSPVGGSGTPGTIPIWNTTTALTDSPLSFATSTLTYSSAVTAQTFAANQTWTLPNNAFAFAVGGTGNATLKLDTNNRYVGIDSPSTPSDKLHLAESGALALRMQNVTAATYWQHKVDGSGNWGLAVNGGTNALTVLSANGNVGIGTASPTDRVTINGGGLAITGSVTGNTQTANTIVVDNIGGATRLFSIGADASTRGSYIFYTSRSGASPSALTAATITGAGDVGIGTTSPSGRLHVVGGTATSGNGTPITLIAQSGQASGNTNGGNIVLTPGSKFGTGTDGLVDLSSPLGTGLKLPATPGNGDAQTLDAYNELGSGTYKAVTATLTCGTSGTITLKSANQSLYVTRVGRTVIVSGFLQVDSVSLPTGRLTITTSPALPSCQDGASANIVFTGPTGLVAGDAILPTVAASTIFCDKFNAGVQSQTAAANMQANTSLWVAFMYHAA
jgi:hypothetical protein